MQPSAPATPPAAASGPDARPGALSPLLLLLVILAGLGALGQQVWTLTAADRWDPRFQAERWVDLTEPTLMAQIDAVPSPEQTTLAVAIAPFLAAERTIRRDDAFVRYLGERVGRTGILVQRPTYTQLNDAIRHRRCDLALVCPGAFVRGERSFGMELLATPVIGGQTTYRALIVVARTSRAAAFLDLRGKRFGVADPLSLAGWAWPVSWLAEHGQEAEEFFREDLSVGTQDRALEAVARGYVEGAGIDSLVYDTLLREKPTLAERVKVILASPPFGLPPLVVHPRIDPRLRAQLCAALLRMHEDPAGARLLAEMGIERFVAPVPGLYDAVRNVVGKSE